MCLEHARDRFWHAGYDPDYRTPGMLENLACWACQRIWHAGHAREFGMPGMAENLACRRFRHAGHAGYELLITRP